MVDHVWQPLDVQLSILMIMFDCCSHGNSPFRASSRFKQFFLSVTTLLMVVTWEFLILQSASLLINSQLGHKPPGLIFILPHYICGSFWVYKERFFVHTGGSIVLSTQQNQGKNWRVKLQNHEHSQSLYGLQKILTNLEVSRSETKGYSTHIRGGHSVTSRDSFSFHTVSVLFERGTSSIFHLWLINIIYNRNNSSSGLGTTNYDLGPQQNISRKLIIKKFCSSGISIIISLECIRAPPDILKRPGMDRKMRAILERTGNNQIQPHQYCRMLVPSGLTPSFKYLDILDCSMSGASVVFAACQSNSPRLLKNFWKLEMIIFKNKRLVTFPENVFEGRIENHSTKISWFLQCINQVLFDFLDNKGGRLNQEGFIVKSMLDLFEVFHQKLSRQVRCQPSLY
ncbi:hypothetical protein VP01_2548g2 [Puccinia sorghi]|uniref:Uncharacterized protein n=1 Tax=Puccinia sorghi TaxID=27349 RepID=A0A0L6V725_9BASI|nr:hypothetical protein VP01_2548g2 [Puccinia sorghi]